MATVLKIKTAVVILNWNGRHFLEKFLPTAIRYTDNTDTKIVVADNGSTDDSVVFLKQHFPETVVILLEKNHGFSKGYNLALQQIEANYFVMLNSDVEVTENWLQPIIYQLDTNKNIGAAMPKILAYHNKNSFEYAGASGGFIDKYGYPFCRGRIMATLEQDNQQYNSSIDVFWASGAAMIIRAEAFYKSGRLDDDFFAHMEEIDLCWRMKNKGYAVKVFPKSVVFHVGGGTLDNESPFKLKLNYRNNLLMLYKNLPTTKLLPIIFARLFLDGISAILYLWQGKPKLVGAVWKAHLEFYRLVAKIKPKRKAQKQFLNQSFNQIYKGSIVFQYFIKKKKHFSDLNFNP